jgi:hypothetical protein
MDRKEFLLRMPAEDHAALRALAQVTGRPMNELATCAVREYLLGTGRREFVAASAARTKEQYEVLLDKLAH